MKKIFALLAVVLGMVSCQTEPEGLDVNVGGEQDVTVCVSLPEATRADSAVGALDNNVLDGDATLRYILQVFQKVENTWVVSKETKTEYSDENNVVFGVRLVPNRDYKFVVWADIVDGENAGDKYYTTVNNEGTTDLTNITVKAWNAMDEARDAYTAVELVESYSGASQINVKLTRPFAKLRVITTDMVELGHLGIAPHNAVVTYTTKHYASFNACNATYSGEVENVEHRYEIANYADNTEKNKVLFTDYFFADDSDVVKFNMTVKEANGATINKEINFNTDIPAKRNHLTTIKGNILTEANNVEVKVVENGAFAGYENWPDTDAEQLAYAAMFGGEVTLTEDVVLTQPLTIAEGVSLVLNLNGQTLKNQVENAATDVILVEEGAILTINGEGTVEAVTGNDGYAVIANGTVIINGGTFKSGVDTNGEPNAVVYARGNGKVYVNGGYFPNDNASKFVLNKKDANRATTVIEVRGGQFENFNPANNDAENAGTNFCAEGYGVLAENNVYTVVEGAIATSKNELVDALNNGTDSNIYFGAEINMGTTGISLNRDLTLNMNNKKLNIYSGAGVGNYSFNLNNHKLTVNDADMQTEGFYVAFDSSLTFNSGKIFYKSSKNGRNLFYVASNNEKTATVTINGGDFSIDTVNQPRVRYIAAAGNAIVYINGGNFGVMGEYNAFDISTLNGYTGQIIISGGTFKFNPTTYGATIAEGYVCSESNGTWTVVAE